MKYSIIIPTYNNSSDTITCLESIAKHTMDYVIAWVDDGSKKEHIQNVQRFLDEQKIPHFALQNTVNQGFIKSVNKGIKAAMETDAQYIILQNNDTIVYENWLETMADIAQSKTSIGLVGPMTGGSKQSPQYLSRFSTDFPKEILKNYQERSSEHFHQFLQKKYQKGSIRTFERLAFFSVLIKREVIDAVGSLDEQYGTGYYDDDDYCERVFRKGWDAYIAQGVFVKHNAEQTFMQDQSHEQWLEKKRRIYAHNKELFDRKFHYGDYATDVTTVSDQRELQIRLWRMNRLVTKKNWRISEMEKTPFWKMQNHYRRMKKTIIPHSEKER